MAMRQRVLLLKDSPILATGIFLTIFDARNYETHNDEQKPHLKSYNLFKMVSERFEIQQQIPLGFLGGASGKEPACQSRRYKRCGTELQRVRHDWATEHAWSSYHWRMILLFSQPPDHQTSHSSLVAQTVKNPPAVWETWAWSLYWEDPLEQGMATHSCILAWRIPLDRGAWWDAVHGVPKSWTWLNT